MKIVAVTDNTN